MRWGISLNCTVADPVADEPVHLEAARRIDGLHNRFFLDAVLRGEYPADVLRDTAHLGWDDRGWQHVIRDGDLDLIGAPIDVLGVNYYHGDAVSGITPGSYRPPRIPAAARLLAVPHGRVRRGRAARPPAHGHGLGGPARRAAPAARAASTRTTRRRRCTSPRPGRRTSTGSSTAGSTTPSGVAFLDAYLRAVHDAMAEGVEWAASSCGRSSTTSSGPTATTSASASCTSTTTRSGVRRSPARTGTPRWPARVSCRLGAGIATVTAVNSLPTLDEVARVAGVSRATASRAINGGSRVSASARAAGRRGGALARLRAEPGRPQSWSPGGPTRSR